MSAAKDYLAKLPPLSEQQITLLEFVKSIDQHIEQFGTKVISEVECDELYGSAIKS